MHHETAPPWLILSFIAVIMVYLLYPGKPDPEKKRVRDLAAVAAKLNFSFRTKYDIGLIERYVYLTHFSCGVDRYAYNILSGSRDGAPVFIFDHHFDIITVAGAGSSGHHHHYFSALLVEMPAEFPCLRIRPETWKSRLAEELGHPQIAFESAEFTRAFAVQASEPKFAYEVCHPQMMEFLLANRDLSVEVNRSALVLLSETTLRPAEVERSLARLMEIRQLLPHYLLAGS
jgi:hypothetical protein